MGLVVSVRNAVACPSGIDCQVSAVLAELFYDVYRGQFVHPRPVKDDGATCLACPGGRLHTGGIRVVQMDYARGGDDFFADVAWSEFATAF